MITCWSAKGGSGVSVVAALLAIACSRRGSTTLVDCVGDQPSIFGVADPATGFRDWSQAGSSVGTEALTRLAVPLSQTLHLIGAGRQLTAGVLAGVETRLQFMETAIFDGGLDHPANVFLPDLIQSSAMSLLVMRPCYLAARRASKTSCRVDGLIVVDEPGRALTGDDLSDVVGAPVVAQIPWDLSIARTVDAGRLGNRLPKAARSLEKLAGTICNDSQSVMQSAS